MTGLSRIVDVPTTDGNALSPDAAETLTDLALDGRQEDYMALGAMLGVSPRWLALAWKGLTDYRGASA